MKTCQLAAVAAACAVLAACGGNSGGDDTPTPPAGATTYPEVSPVLGQVDTFATVTTDDAANAVNRGYEERVTAAGADGSYTLEQDDPSNFTTTINGITYHYIPTVRTFGPTAGGNVQTGYTETLPSGASKCTQAFHGAHRAVPMWVGETWSLSYTITCGSTVTNYTDVGAVDAAESVTVPAGTFTALKMHAAISWTTAAGQNVVEQSTNWVDPAHGFFTLKREVVYQRSGTVPAHFVTGQTVELQSRH